MTVFGRKRKLPAELTPSLDRGERVVAWGSTSDGGAVVATDLGLWLPGRPARLGWHGIHKATWRDGVLTVTPADPVADGDGYALLADGAPTSVALEEPGDLPHEVRTRVTRSVVYTEHFATSDGGGVRVVGRKVPRVDGLTWQVRADTGTDATDPALAEAIAAVVAETAAGLTEAGHRPGRATGP